MSSNDQGEYAERDLDEGVLEATTVPGFTIQVEWLWSELDHFPSTLEVVQGLLAQ